MNKKVLLVVVGPTASGKTKLAIEIALKYNTEIISADSRQIYKDLIIGTAQPTIQEQCLVKHYLVNFVDLDATYSVADYEKDASRILKMLFKEHDVVVMCGGTGLYINAICFGIDEIPDISQEKRNYVRSLYKNNDLKYCVDLLKQHDHECEKFLDIRNPHRVLRALEVILETKKPIREFYSNNNKKTSFDIFFINIDVEKEVLYNRIDLRVDEMIKNGLVDEVKQFEKYRNYNSLKTIGYNEIFEYLDNKITLNEAIENIKINTKKYAKRQMTWFKKVKRNNLKIFINYKTIK
jgi:tRNA dimethylallyltransferase